MASFAGVLLVDPRGWVLLQERDEHPVIDPCTWGLCGGHLEEGEDFESGARRELEEETGIRLRPGQLVLWRVVEVRRPDPGAGAEPLPRCLDHHPRLPRLGAVRLPGPAAVI